MIELTEAIARKVRDTVDAGLVLGRGKQVAGQMCVEAAVCFALGLPHSDHPPCVGAAVRSYKIKINDANWSSRAARARGMRRVAIAQLGSDAIDQRAFADYVCIEGVKRILPIALRAVAKAVPGHADAILATIPACEAAVTLDDARQAASASRKEAADADAANAAADAAIAAANAAAYAAAAAAAYGAAAYAAAYATVTIAISEDSAYDTNAAYAAAAYAYAADAAIAAAYAAAYTADVVAIAEDVTAIAEDARNSVLSLAAEISVEALQKLGSKGCEWLYLCDEETT